MLDHVAAPIRPGEMAALIRGYDWASTSLGPRSTWPVHLGCAVDIALPSRAQIVMFCGPEFLAIYNDAYAPTIGKKHPAALGKPAREHWGELWEDLEPLLRRVYETGETVVAAKATFDARLRNLARAHDLLTHGSWRNASLAKVVAETLSPYPNDHFDIDGPDVSIPPKAVLAMALILHELATNAAKYGAFSVQSGRVSVSWTLDPSTDAHFILSWQERGGPPVTPPSRAGFGLRLIENLVCGQLRGGVDMHYDRVGVRCELNAPLASDWGEIDRDLTGS